MPELVHPEVLKSEDLLDDFHGQRSDWASQAMEDDEFRNNSQWNNIQNVLNPLEEKSREH